MLGMSRCKKPIRVTSSAPCDSQGTGEVNAKADRDSEAPRLMFTPGLKSAREEIGRNPGQGFCRRPSKVSNPREQPAARVLNTCGPPGTLRKVKTQKPRRPCRLCACTSRAWQGNGMWVHSSGNVRILLREEKASKGESQERCRRERKPARDRRE
jgi:hypothetical protein